MIWITSRKRAFSQDSNSWLGPQLPGRLDLLSCCYDARAADDRSFIYSARRVHRLRAPRYPKSQVAESVAMYVAAEPAGPATEGTEHGFQDRGLVCVYGCPITISRL